MTVKQKIKNILKNLPAEPGVYLMKDASGSIIYIGKASILKKRVSSYFQKKDHDPKTAVLVKNIEDIEYIITDSEIEALILESNLIKKHKPRFNIRLKDDKKYPYIAVTFDEKYPRVRYTRKIIHGSNRYFGPYTDAKAAKNTVSMINSVFKLKTCSRDIPLKKNDRPCLNYQINRCHGPCIEKINREEYKSIVNNAVKFLEGNIEPVLKDLKKTMNSYSSDMQFEKAAGIRDIIYDIQKISETQKVSVPIGMDQDYIEVSIKGNEGIAVLFEFRKGVLLGRKIRIFENTEYSMPQDLIKLFILDYYSREDIPHRVITSHRLPDRHLLEKFLTDKSSRSVLISSPSTADDRGILRMITKNLDIIFADKEASTFQHDSEKGLIELKEKLCLLDIPERIECFDISNTQGTFSVASMVCFTNGIPDNTKYRRYRIKAYDSSNDPGMIHEAVGRRIQYLTNEKIDYPDLIVIDGGRTQLARAMEAAKNFSGNIKIISLAKKMEEIYYSPEKAPLRLPETSPALHILQNIRDEAHRFAITYHRKLRDKSMKESELEQIPGIGPKTRNELFKHFKTMDKIQHASLEELKNISGIGESTAEIIFNFFKLL